MIISVCMTESISMYSSGLAVCQLGSLPGSAGFKLMCQFCLSKSANMGAVIGRSVAMS